MIETAAIVRPIQIKHLDTQFPVLEPKQLQTDQLINRAINVFSQSQFAVIKLMSNQPSEPSSGSDGEDDVTEEEMQEAIKEAEQTEERYRNYQESNAPTPQPLDQ